MLAKIKDRVSNEVAAWRAASLQPLEVPLFRALWIASVVSNVGSMIQTVGASWSMAELTSSPQMVALVQTASLLPMVILALPAGALADIADRRTVMLASQIIGLFGTAALAAFALFGAVTPLHLLAFTALVGCAVAVHQPAWQASFGDIVPRAALPAAIGLNSLAFNTARSLGPAIGGALVAALGSAAAFVLNALCFFALIGVLAAKRLPTPTRTLPPEPVGAAMQAGLRFVAMSPALRAIMMRNGLFALGGSALFSLIPVIAQQQLSGDAIDYGLLLGAFGVGSLCAALLMASVRTRLGSENVVQASTLGFGIATLAAALSPSLPLTLVIMFGAGAFWIFAFSTLTTCIQMCSPRWVGGRAVALGQVSGLGALALGSAFWGAGVDTFGLLGTFTAAAVFMIASLAVAPLARLPGIDFDDLSPREPVDVASPVVEMDTRTGPIVVTIEYRVPAADSAAFLAAMHELGRMRRRNGAQRWSVHQDIDRPDLWEETIESATWMDHLRRADRGTVADQLIVTRVAAYRTASPPRRMVGRPVGANALE